MRSSVDQALSPDLCTVVEEAAGPGASAEVFHVLEPFGNCPALRRIGEALLRLLRATEVRLYCVEAAFGPLPHEMLLQQARAKGGEPLPERIEKGELEHLEYLTLAYEDPLDVCGVEDRELYTRTLGVGRPLIASRHEWSSRLRGLRLRLLREGLAGLSADYGEFLKRSSLSGGDGELDEFELPLIENLLDDAETCGIDLTLFRQFRLLREVKELERRIDFETAQAEAIEAQQLVAAVLIDRGNLVRGSFLQSGLAVDAMTAQRAGGLMRGERVPPEVLARMDRTPLGLLLRSAAGRAIRGGAPLDLWGLFERTHAALDGEFRRLLEAKPQEAAEGGDGDQTAQLTFMRRAMVFTLEMFPLVGVQPEQFPNFVRYAHYLARFSRLDMVSAVKDLETVVELLMQAMARSEIDRLHAALTASLSAMGRLFALECTPGQFGWLVAHSSELDHQTLCDGLARCLGGQASLGDFADIGEATDDRLDDCMSYYSLMMERGNAMARNTRAAMRDRGVTRAILVTGGFHSETVARNFASFGFSRVVITPRVTRATTRDEMDGYFETLSSQGGVR